MNQQKSYSTAQVISLIILRITIGWHFLYEGLYKYFKHNWTAKHYLSDADGWLGDLFVDMAANPTAIAIVDALNIWGLILIGIALIVGGFTKYASIAGVAMLALFYLSHIPFIGASYIMAAEGNYLWVDKNIIEIGALLVIITFPTSHIIGIDRFLANLGNKKQRNEIGR